MNKAAKIERPIQRDADVSLLLHVDGRWLSHQRGLLRHHQEEVLRHQLLVRLHQVAGAVQGSG